MEKILAMHVAYYKGIELINCQLPVPSPLERGWGEVKNKSHEK
jgi:hypothetical protein